MCLKKLQRRSWQNVLIRLCVCVAVVQTLAHNSTASLSVIKDYLINKLERETQQIEEDERKIQQYREETTHLRAEIQELKTWWVKQELCPQMTHYTHLYYTHLYYIHLYYTHLYTALFAQPCGLWNFYGYFVIRHQGLIATSHFFVTQGRLQQSSAWCPKFHTSYFS